MLINSTKSGVTWPGILQASILECLAFPFSRGSSQPRDRNQVSSIAGGFFYQLSHKGSPRKPRKPFNNWQQHCHLESILQGCHCQHDISKVQQRQRCPPQVWRSAFPYTKQFPYQKKKLVGKAIYTLVYLKWITNKNLLFSTWSSAQYYVAAWMGGILGGEWIHVYVWLSPFTVHLKLSQHC